MILPITCQVSWFLQPATNFFVLFGTVGTRKSVSKRSFLLCGLDFDSVTLVYYKTKEFHLVMVIHTTTTSMQQMYFRALTGLSHRLVSGYGGTIWNNWTCKNWQLTNERKLKFVQFFNQDWMSDLEIFSLLISAIIHDYNHSGKLWVS